jgi:hypothetical protein
VVPFKPDRLGATTPDSLIVPYNFRFCYAKKAIKLYNIGYIALQQQLKIVSKAQFPGSD